MEPPASSKVAALIAPLPDHVDYLELREVVEMADDPLLFRLFLEYLPLTFSRWHETHPDPGTSFRSTSSQPMAIKVWRMRATGAIFFRTGKPCPPPHPDSSKTLFASLSAPLHRTVITLIALRKVVSIGKNPSLKTLGPTLATGVIIRLSTFANS